MVTTHDTPEAAHRPKVRNADLAIRTTCLDCGRECLRVFTGDWVPDRRNGGPVRVSYWRHVPKAKP